MGMLFSGSPVLTMTMEDTPIQPPVSDSESPEDVFAFKSQERAAVDDVDCFSDWRKQDIRKIEVGAGLDNLGNTCFLNSVLQCFMHTVPLLKGIFSNGMSTHSNCSDENFCTLCDLKDLVKLSLKSGPSAVSPDKIFNNLNYFSSNFQKYQQEDAHEFLQCFLDKLGSSGHSDSKECTSSDSEIIVKEVFGGHLVSELTCCSCGHCSNTYEPSIDLSLEIEDADTLVTALQSFTKLEKIEDPENKFTCDNCMEKVFVEKQLSFDQTPLVAVFHLKRFKHDGYFGEKIDKHVAFPVDLDLHPFTGGGQNNDVVLTYSLYAVVVHRGMTSTSGHYYCFIRVSENTWCKFDDSVVVLVDEAFVLSQEAYILFYCKEGTPWFSSFIEAQKLLLDCEIHNTSPTSVLEKETALPSSPDEEHERHPCFCTVLQSENDGNDGRNSITQTQQNRILSNDKDGKCEGVSVSGAVSSCDPQTQVNPSKRKEEQSPERYSRSPSPETYRDDPSDKGVPTPPSRLNSNTSWKRRRVDDVDDLEGMQARLLIRRFPGSRRRQWEDALVAASSHPSFSRKKSARSRFNHKFHNAVGQLVPGSYR